MTGTSPRRCRAALAEICQAGLLAGVTPAVAWQRAKAVFIELGRRPDANEVSARIPATPCGEPPRTAH